MLVSWLTKAHPIGNSDSHLFAFFNYRSICSTVMQSIKSSGLITCPAESLLLIVSLLTAPAWKIFFIDNLADLPRSCHLVRRRKLCLLRLYRALVKEFSCFSWVLYMTFGFPLKATFTDAKSDAT